MTGSNIDAASPELLKKESIPALRCWATLSRW